MNIWDILGISPTSDIAKIRKAYAVKSKIYHPEIDPEGFHQLYQAYQEAIAKTKIQRRRPVLKTRVISQLKTEKMDSGLQTDKANIEFENAKFKNTSFEDTEFKNTELENTGFKNTECKRNIQSEPEEIEIAYDFERLLRNHQQKEAEEKRYYENSGALKEFIRLYSDKRQKATKKEWADYFTSEKEYKKWLNKEWSEQWSNYFTSEVFLGQQYDEKFLRYLIEYLKEQQIVEVSDMAKPIFLGFCISYGILSKKDSKILCEIDKNEEILYKERLKDLIPLLNIHNKKEEYFKLIYSDKTLQEKIEAFQNYHLLLKMKRLGDSLPLKSWETILEYIQCYNTPNKNEKEVPLFYQLIAYFIKTFSAFPKEVYQIFYQKFEVESKKYSLKNSYYLPICKALKEIQTQEQKEWIDQKKEMEEEIKFLITDYKNLCIKLQTQENKNQEQEIEAFFEHPLFQKLFQTREMIQRLTDYYKNCSSVPYSLWSKTYKLYVKNPEADKLIRFMEYGIGIDRYRSFVTKFQKEQEESLEYHQKRLGKEIRNKKQREQWISETFFYSGLTKVWKSATKASMRVEYRERLKQLLESGINRSNFYYDMLTDGILKIIWKENVVLCHEDKCVTISYEDFYGWMEEHIELYLNKYFCISSEKEQFIQKLKRLEYTIYEE